MFVSPEFCSVYKVGEGVTVVETVEVTVYVEVVAFNVFVFPVVIPSQEQAEEYAEVPAQEETYVGSAVAEPVMGTQDVIADLVLEDDDVVAWRLSTSSASRFCRPGRVFVAVIVEVMVVVVETMVGHGVIVLLIKDEQSFDIDAVPGLTVPVGFNCLRHASVVHAARLNISS